MDNKADFINFLAQNDPLGLLKKECAVKCKSTHSVLIQNFEEIVDFFEENNREPQKNSDDIYEFQLYCRLNSIRLNSNMVKALKKYDLNGLLDGVGISSITLEDILGHDPLNLLNGELDNSIFSLYHVRPSERISPEYISRRKFCEDFEKYKDMFDTLLTDLENGIRKLAVYHSEDLRSNRFFVLRGVIMYLESVDGTISSYSYNSGERQRYDGRTHCIFDNGTESDMLFRSLDKALQKDGYSITDYEESTSALKEINDCDIVKGYVYVLKSYNSKLKDVADVYKIGSTRTSVTERIRNARNEPTYLYADVDVVEVYRCYNMDPRLLEDKLQTFFDNVRLNINIPDERGVVISPREWFCVNIEAISEAVDRILDASIKDYIYDPQSKRIIAKKVL